MKKWILALCVGGIATLVTYKIQKKFALIVGIATVAIGFYLFKKSV